MAEQFKSITEMRRELPTLSQSVQGGADQFVITNQGKPQAVLLGYKEYMGLRAAVELLRRPKELADLEEGLAQTQKLSFEQLKKNLSRRKAAQSQAEATVIVEEAAQPASAFSIDQRLDELRGDMRRILERLGAGEMASRAAREAAREGTVSIPGLPAAPSKARIGKSIKVELMKVSGAGRRRSAIRDAQKELKAER